MLTKRDQLAILDTAHNDGVAEGLKKGLEKGRKEGLEEGLEKGREEGLEKGLEKGREAERLRLLKNMLENGIRDKMISALLGIDAEELARMKKSIGS